MKAMEQEIKLNRKEIIWLLKEKIELLQDDGNIEIPLVKKLFHAFWVLDAMEFNKIATENYSNRIKNTELEKAYSVFLEAGEVNIELLQRKFRIGKIKAETLIEEMEELKWISPSIGNKKSRLLK